MTASQAASSPSTPASGVALYERMGERTTQPFAVQLLDRLMPLAGRSLIDVAAGTGGLAVVAAERGAQVLATDISSPMVERTAKRLHAFEAAGAEVMGFQALAVDDARYDLAVSNFGVLAFATWRTGLDEMVRVTRPGGRIALAMWTHGDDCSPAHLMRRVFTQAYPDRELWPAGLFPVLTEEGLRDGLLACGCTKIDVRVVAAEWSPYDSLGVVRECDPMFRSFPGYAALGEDEAASLRASLQEAFDGYADADGVIRLPTKAFVAVATREGGSPD